MADNELQLQKEAERVYALQQQLESEVLANPDFQKLLQFQKDLNDKIAEGWKALEGKMILGKVKSIKGDFGSVTIAERIGFDVDEDKLPKKFFKKVVDTKRLADTYKLERKDIPGASVKYTQYLTKRIKGVS